MRASFSLSPCRQMWAAATDNESWASPTRGMPKTHPKRSSEETCSVAFAHTLQFSRRKSITFTKLIFNHLSFLVRARRPLETQFICSFDLHDAAVAFNAFCRHISIAFMDDWSNCVCVPNATTIQKIHEIKKKTRQKLKPVASTGHLSATLQTHTNKAVEVERKNKNFAWLKTRSFDLIEIRYVVRYIYAIQIKFAGQRAAQNQKQNSLFSSLRRSHTSSSVHTYSMEVLAARQPASLP